MVHSVGCRASVHSIAAVLLLLSVGPLTGSRLAAGADPDPASSTALQQAQRRLGAADEALKRAKRALRGAQQRVEDAREAQQDALRKVEEAKGQLERAQAELQTADAGAAEAQHRYDEARAVIEQIYSERQGVAR